MSERQDVGVFVKLNDVATRFNRSVVLLESLIFQYYSQYHLLYYHYYDRFIYFDVTIVIDIFISLL